MSRPIGAHSAVGALFWSTPLDDPQRNALGSSNAGYQQGPERQEQENPAAQGSDPNHDEAGGRQQALGPHGDPLAAQQGHRDSHAIVEVRSFVKAVESLQEANQKRLKALGKKSGKAPALRKFDWSAAADAFLESMEGRRGGTLANLKSEDGGSRTLKNKANMGTP